MPLLSLSRLLSCFLVFASGRTVPPVSSVSWEDFPVLGDTLHGLSSLGPPGVFEKHLVGDMEIRGVGSFSL